MKIGVHEVYLPPKCTCGTRPIVEHDTDGAYSVIPSRVRCSACGRHTEWKHTRFQAEIAWEKGETYEDG